MSKKLSFSYQLDADLAVRLKLLASGVGKTPSALVQEVVVALITGQVKLPLPKTIKEVYQ